jgi:hypothetical protein
MPKPVIPLVGWFSEKSLPALSDGHEPRIKFGFKFMSEANLKAHFE